MEVTLALLRRLETQAKAGDVDAVQATAAQALSEVATLIESPLRTFLKQSQHLRAKLLADQP